MFTSPTFAYRLPYGLAENYPNILNWSLDIKQFFLLWHTVAYPKYSVWGMYIINMPTSFLSVTEISRSDKAYIFQKEPLNTNFRPVAIQ